MQIINNLRKLEYKIPDDIIKYSLIELSVSPESFFLLRTNFITSLATMNTAHWVLGIGDRHLSNILINQKDAVMLGKIMINHDNHSNGQLNFLCFVPH